MTAEVAVLNQLGVALAADSAVSVGQRAEKIWTSAEKLFQLSYADPVGAMVYGSASCLGLPWETIIKVYRRATSKDSLPTVAGHGERLISALAADRALFPVDAQLHWFSQFCYSIHFAVGRTLRDRLDQESEQRDGLTEDEVGDVVASVVAEEFAQTTGLELIPGFPTEAAVSDQRLIDAAAKSAVMFFGAFPLSDVARDQLVAMPLEALVRKHRSPQLTGLVLAGFGADELLPALWSFEIDGVVLDHVRGWVHESQGVDRWGSAQIVPFAQQEMVQLFMEGIDGEFEQTLLQAVRSSILALSREIGLDLVGAEKWAAEESRLKAPTLRAVEQLFERMAEYKREYWVPVIQNVASLPKDELAFTAEALVNLTKFRRRASTDRETVGGPIDVALITKGDGFVWIKRKHYFDQDRNVRALGQRLRGES